MIRKGTNPDQPAQADTGTDTKRRYQSGPTPPRMPHETKASAQDQRQRENGRTDTTSSEDRPQQERQGGLADATSTEAGPRQQEDRELNGDVAANGEADDDAGLDLQRASREQLVETARDLDIVDFEDMSREDLVQSIQEAR